MKDELLIRFIDGNTTPEETDLVINELSKDGEFAKEWIQMVQGARIAGTEPLQNIVPTDVISRTLTEKSVNSRRVRVISLPWIISGISAVAASVAIIVAVMIKSDNTGVPENIIANVGDTTEVICESDTLAVDTSLKIGEVSNESIADAQISEDLFKNVSNTKDADTVNERKIQELVGKKYVNETSTASEIKNTEIIFEMVKPAKTPYKVKVNNIGKDFIFEWTTNASEIRISITDSKGDTIIREDNISGNNYSVAASALVNRGGLIWKLEATFNDGTVREKSGSIELVYIK